ncbi:MAG: hypothetical protein U0359_22840 [Byssovorax sp.]
MGRHPWLSREEIQALHEAAIDANLENRTVLFSGIERLVMGLPVMHVPKEQILSDLNQLNVTGAADDGVVPLVVWLDNAVAVTHPKAAAAVFQQARERILAQRDAPAKEPARDRGEVPAPDALLRDDLRKLEAQIAAQLFSAAELTRALLAVLQLSLEPGKEAEQVARALVHVKKGEEVVKALCLVHDQLSEQPGQRDNRQLAQRLVWQVLPFATDWRAWVEVGRAKLAGGEAFVDLPLANETLAEMILAGIDCRACRYEKDSPRGPLGGALLRKPAAARAPLLDLTGQRLVEATVGHLATKLLGLSPDDPRLRDHERMRADVDEALEYYADAVGEDRLPRWLLLDNEILVHMDLAAGDGERRTAVAVGALGQALPHLRILRGGPGLPGEQRLALHIGGMWRRGAGAG